MSQDNLQLVRRVYDLWNQGDIQTESIARCPWFDLARSHRVRDAMALTMCAASLPTPGRKPDDIA
jgi:hypothetical protein